MGDELDITLNDEGSKVTYTLVGNLTTISGPYLKDEVAKLGDDVKDIDLEINGLDYIAESGFDLLQEIDGELKAKGGKLTLLHPNEFVADIIDDLDLKSVFTVVE